MITIYFLSFNLEQNFARYNLVYDLTQKSVHNMIKLQTKLVHLINYFFHKISYFAQQNQNIVQVFLSTIFICINNKKMLILTLCFILNLAQVQAQQTSKPQKRQIVSCYSFHARQCILLDKYFHGMDDGYFIELGGFNPLFGSNNIKLSNWKGIIVQANQQRASDLRDYQISGVQVLNFGITNVTGTMATFYETQFDQASSMSAGAVRKRKSKQLQVMTISLADLCHKYYKRRMNFMSLDVQGIGQSVLRSNDWSNQKCIPDIIYAEDSPVNVMAGETRIKQYLGQHNYTLMTGKKEKLKENLFFIHKSKIQLYQSKARQNAQYLRQRSKKIHVLWYRTLQPLNLQIILGRLIHKTVKGNFHPSSSPYYVHVRQNKIIDVIQLNKHSNFISTVGENRPIMIMEYDYKKSMIFLQDHPYTIQNVSMMVDFKEHKNKTVNFKKIKTNADGAQLIIYVLDHQKYDNFSLNILSLKQNNFNQSFNKSEINQIQKVQNQKNQSKQSFTISQKNQYQRNQTQKQSLTFLQRLFKSKDMQDLIQLELLILIFFVIVIFILLAVFLIMLKRKEKYGSLKGVRDQEQSRFTDTNLVQRES